MNLGDVDLCAGYGISGIDLYNYWETHDCPSTFSTYLNTSQNGTLTNMPVNLDALQYKLQNLFTVYFSENELEENPSNSFQRKILNMCLDPRLPQACIYFAPYCKDIPRGQLVDYCGCFNAQPGPSSGDGNEGSGNVYPAACDPLCHRVNTIQIGPPCPSNVCVIDDVSIQVANSSVRKGVNLTNLCPYCGDGNLCICIVSGVSVSENLLDVGIGTQINQYCGENSICYENGREVDCNIAANKKQRFPISINWYLLIIALLVIIIVFLAILIIRDNRKSSLAPVTL